MLVISDVLKISLVPRLIESKLGIATANIPLKGLEIGGYSDLESGVYYGWAGIDLPTSIIGDKKAENLSTRKNVYPMVMSIGWNPFYKNTVRSVVSDNSSMRHKRSSTG
jgi:FAD synthase